MLKDYELLYNNKNHWKNHEILKESLKLRQTYMSLLQYLVMHLANPNKAILDCLDDVELAIVSDHSYKHLMNVQTKHIKKYSNKLVKDKLKRLMSPEECIDYRIIVVVDALYLLNMVKIDLQHNRIAYERLPMLVDKLSLSKKEKDNLIDLVNELFGNEDQRFSREVVNYLKIV